MQELCLLYLLRLLLWPQFQTSLRENLVHLVYPPPLFTLPAYYPAPAAEKRQARVFMASIKIVCIPSHLHPVIYSAFDKHTE